MKNMLSLALLLGVMNSAQAADWTGTGEAGLLIADGNTEAETANARLELQTEIGTWLHAAGLAALYASTEGDKTAQRWEAFGQSDYNFGPKSFAFGAGRYEQDEFSGFEYQATLSTGIGRHFIETERTTLTGTAGVGYKFYETRDAFDDLGNLLEEGDDDSEAILRGTADFEHFFNETTSFVNNFIVESGADNSYLENAAAIKVKMNAKLALAVGYTIRHNADPTDGFEETDTLTTVNLVYEIR
jgi:putative salt-induced outer membrane protein